VFDDETVGLMRAMAGEGKSALQVASESGATAGRVRVAVLGGEKAHRGMSRPSWGRCVGDGKRDIFQRTAEHRYAPKTFDDMRWRFRMTIQDCTENKAEPE